MPKKVIRGTGITAHEVTLFDPSEAKEPLREWAKSWNRAINEGGGEFGAVSLQALRECKHILANSPPAPYPEDSQEAFAHHVAVSIRRAKKQIEIANADLAARLAFDAGVQWARATMKWAWEDDALRGEKVKKAASEGAGKTNAPKILKGNIQMARMAELLGEDMPIFNAAAKVAEEFGVSTESIRQKYYKKKSSEKV